MVCLTEAEERYSEVRLEPEQRMSYDKEFRGFQLSLMCSLDFLCFCFCFH